MQIIFISAIVYKECDVYTDKTGTAENFECDARTVSAKSFNFMGEFL